MMETNKDKTTTLAIMALCALCLIVGLSLLASGAIDTFKSPERRAVEAQAAAVKVAEREAAKPALVIGLSLLALGAGAGGGYGLFVALTGLGQALALYAHHRAVMVDGRRVVMAESVQISTPEQKLIEGE